MNYKWTEAELSTLRDIYPKHGIKACQALLNRSRDSITTKAHYLKLKAPGAKLKTMEQYEAELFDLDIDAFPLEQYITALTPIKHTCSKDHYWSTRPADILQGHGCPHCSKTGYKTNKAGRVYYVRITKDNETFYKIGITNGTIVERFIADRDKEITVLMDCWYLNGQEAYNKEQELLTQFRQFRQNIPNWLRSGGKTELFEFDVLELDTKKPV